MSMDLTGITNKNEYYTNHYFSTVFEENTNETISRWNAAARQQEEVRTPWSLIRQNARRYYAVHDKFVRSSVTMQTLGNIRMLADLYLESLGYPSAKPEIVAIDDRFFVPVYLEITKENGAPLLWVILCGSTDTDAGIMESFAFHGDDVEEDSLEGLYKGVLGHIPMEELATKILFGAAEPPRFLMLMGMNQIALIDRNKWNEKRYLQFELEEIFSRLENTTLQAMSVLLHRESLCPDGGQVLLDQLDEQSQKNASGVSQDLKYALRESIELLGNEVLYDMAHRLGRDLEAEPVDAGQLTLECLRYMYRMLFVLFIEARPELGYAPINTQSYYSGYSLESLRDIADRIRDDVEDVGDGYYLHETLAKLYELIYDGYPKTEEELKKATDSGSLHDLFLIAPLKAHIFDPDYTEILRHAKLRNSCMLRIVDLMSLTRPSAKKNGRRQRISYGNLGINQMGAVYEALLSYRGFIAKEDLYEVKRAGDSFNELDVGYFVPESELDQYTEEERVRYDRGEKKGKLRMYEKGHFIYRLAGREREKSASYYTPEVLTKCLVKYALKELLEGKTADEILELTICEPAMGSAAFLNEAINQLAEAYISRKEKETGDVIGYEHRLNELQKVKMYIADRNVYGIDLNPVAVELAEVSLWLNTIYKGGYVPWFGTQLVNGNSLIGARRQVYRIENAQATSKGMRWYEMEPERLPFGTVRADKNYKFGRKQIYHFLLGDPGMCSYSDKVIKSLEPDNIRKMAKWNKEFIKPITDDDVITLLRLSSVIDELWEAQIKLRREVCAKTQDRLSVYGHIDGAVDSHTTIRQKDKIYSELYKSEHMRNAGPYARLKFAMDYWCALWFWPIDQADLLPDRSEFFFDMSLILEGTMASVNVTDSAKDGQLSLFPTEMEQIAMDIIDTYGTDTVVDISRLRKENPRLDLAARIAEQNKFMHWELEFADLFAERGGFDLIIGNPPWIKITWNEQAVLADRQPMFAVKKLTANQTIRHRGNTLKNKVACSLYFVEYESLAGEQNFLNAIQNYSDLKGQQTNLFKCFLPQAWQHNAECGISAFIHPEGVYDDPKGGVLREKIYSRLRKHFMFANERKLFPEVDHHTQFSLNVYGDPQIVSFDTICNLYDVKSIAECYDGSPSIHIPRIKDNNGNWNTLGHPKRIIHVTKRELMVFAKLFDGNNKWKQAKLPVLYTKDLVYVLACFSEHQHTLSDISEHICITQMWDETNAQKNGIISRNVHFPETLLDMIYSGPHIGVANPLFKTSRRECRLNSDYDNIDLTNMSTSYLQRINYEPREKEKYFAALPETIWKTKCNDNYRLLFRRMLNLGGERTLIGAIVPPYTGHISTMISISFQSLKDEIMAAGLLFSLPYDAFIKILGKGDMYFDTILKFPFFMNSVPALEIRVLLLNALNENYKSLWRSLWKQEYCAGEWTKDDSRLPKDTFLKLKDTWCVEYPVYSDFARRQLMVEIDVIVAQMFGMTLNQLKVIYQILFPIMQQYETDTWYDANGRIVFTNNRSLIGVGFSRPEFENSGKVIPVRYGDTSWDGIMKHAPEGYVFARTITDDTMPGGPTERTIEYVAPFDRCDREKDYEIAWKFFEEKYSK